MMIRRLLLESLVLFMGAGAIAAGAWVFTGGPKKEATCQAQDLKPGYICFADAVALDNVVWVDARPRELWQKNGYPESVLLTDHPSEDFPTLMAEAFGSLVNAEAVVVYCATEGCGSSEPVAGKIKELDLLSEDRVLVLAGGWKALKLPNK